MVLQHLHWIIRTASRLKICLLCNVPFGRFSVLRLSTVLTFLQFWLTSDATGLIVYNRMSSRTNKKSWIWWFSCHLSALKLGLWGHLEIKITLQDASLLKSKALTLFDVYLQEIEFSIKYVFETFHSTDAFLSWRISAGSTKFSHCNDDNLNSSSSSDSIRSPWDFLPIISLDLSNDERWETEARFNSSVDNSLTNVTMPCPILQIANMANIFIEFFYYSSKGRCSSFWPYCDESEGLHSSKC